MKKGYVLAVLIFMSNICFSQDVITKKTGEDIQAKVIEVGNTEIKFRKSQDGPVYFLAKSEILMIRYSDGTKDLFDEFIAEEKVTYRTENSMTPIRNSWYSRGFIGFSIGPSFPVGDFASHSFNNEEAGFATTGLNLNINFSYKFSNNIGFTMLFSESSNEFYDGEYFSGDILGIPGDWKATGDSWVSDNIMGGLLLSFPSDKVDFDIRALVGYSFVVVPEVKFTDRYYGDYITIQSTSAEEVAYNFGMGLKFNVNKNMAISINADYFSTYPSFSQTVTYDDNGNIAIYSDKIPGDMLIEMLNISVGVGYRFN